MFQCSKALSKWVFICVLQSGAIMTVLAAVCTKIPEAKLGIVLLPMISFTAGNVSGCVKWFKCILFFCMCGVRYCCGSNVVLYVLGFESANCFGYSWSSFGLEVFWSCGPSWWGSVWNVSVSFCYTPLILTGWLFHIRDVKNSYLPIFI